MVIQWYLSKTGSWLPWQLNYGDGHEIGVLIVLSLMHKFHSGVHHVKRYNSRADASKYSLQ